MAKKSRRIKVEKAGVTRKDGQIKLSLVGEWWIDALVLVAMVIYGVVVWWPTRYLPYHWESASLVATGAHDLLLRNLWPPVLVELRTAHQTGFMTVLALLWKVFGESRLVSHMMMVPALPVYMFATYWIGKKIYSPILGIMAGFVVGVLPVAVAEYGMLSVELWMAAVAVTAVAVWSSNKKMLAMMILAVAVLIKGSAIWVMPAMMWWEWMERKNTKKINYKVFFVPVASLLGWYVYHMSVTGWPFVHPEVPLVLLDSVNRFLRYLVFVAKMVATSHWRLVLTGAAAVAAGLLWERKKLHGREAEKTVGMVLAVMAGLVYFAIKGAFSEGQALFILPMLVMVCLWLVGRALEEMAWFDKNWGVTTFGVAVVMAFLIQWQPKVEPAVGYMFTREADLSYQDFIYVARASAITVQVNFPSAKIYGGYPEYYQLTETYQGYVNRSVNFDLCGNFVPGDEKIQLVYLHPYHPSQQACRLLLDQFTFKPVQRIENNGIWLEVYQYEATPSGELDSANES